MIDAHGNFQHKRFNELIVAARAELDDNKRWEMYAECQKIVSDEGGSIITMFANILMAINDKVGFENVAANFDLDGWITVPGALVVRVNHSLQTKVS